MLSSHAHPPHVKLHPFTAELRNVALCPYRQSIWATWAQKNIIVLHSSSLIHSFLIWINKNPNKFMLSKQTNIFLGLKSNLFLTKHPMLW